MQVKKDRIRDTILVTAREEFFIRGFKDASMRSIASNAGVSLSNIYNYFNNKNEIFIDILSPAISELDKLFEDHNNEEHLNVDIFISKDYMGQNIIKYVDLIIRFRKELQILFFESHGSDLESYKKDLIQQQSKNGKEYLLLMKQKYPNMNPDISGFFVHVMSSWWIFIISELTMHKLTRKELKKYLTEYMEFTTAGWKQIMFANKINNEGVRSFSNTLKEREKEILTNR